MMTKLLATTLLIVVSACGERHQATTSESQTKEVYRGSRYTEVELTRNDAKRFYSALTNFEIFADCPVNNVCTLSSNKIICHEEVVTPEGRVSSCYEVSDAGFRWREVEKAKPLMSMVKEIYKVIYFPQESIPASKERFVIESIGARREGDSFYEVRLLLEE